MSSSIVQLYLLLALSKREKCTFSECTWNMVTSGTLSHDATAFSILTWGFRVENFDSGLNRRDYFERFDMNLSMCTYSDPPMSKCYIISCKAKCKRIGHHPSRHERTFACRDAPLLGNSRHARSKNSSPRREPTNQRSAF